MSRASLSGAAICGLCSVLIVVVAFTASRNRTHNRATTPPITTTMVSSAGPLLNNFFEGTKPSPSYSLARMLAVRRAMPECGKKKSRFLQGLSEITTVHAQDKNYCPRTECGGDGWTEFEDECNTGGPCSGSYENTEFDGMSMNGYVFDGDYCGQSWACGCVSFIC